MKPYKYFPVASYIKDELEDENIDIDTFREHSGIDKQLFDSIMNNECKITPEIAEVLVTHFGYDADFWIMIDKEYREIVNRKE